jgi:hypothetical protein
MILRLVIIVFFPAADPKRWPRPLPPARGADGIALTRTRTVVSTDVGVALITGGTRGIGFAIARTEIVIDGGLSLTGGA